MKKALSVILGLAFLLSVLFTPFVSQATTNDEQSAEELIASLEAKIADLKAEINELLAQLEIIKGQRKQAQTALQLARRLSLGMSGDDIKLLQEFLATDPDIYPEGLITGYFGRLTEAAIKRFQKKMCVEQVGLVGPKTFSKINELLTEGAGSSGKVPPGLLRAPGIQKKLCVIATSTPDTVAPVISGIVSTSTTATTTQIEWDTDELANSKVWYSTSTLVVAAAPTASVSSSDYVLHHSISLSDLLASTTYHYLVTSIDKSGNATTAAEESFVTLGE